MAKQETAEVKKTAKKAEKAPAKTTRTVADLRSKDLKQLLDELKNAQADLADARRSLVAGELVNPNVISKYRKEIARIQTVIASKAREVQGKEDA
ncbi:MAG TPA: 50S ribosomal protein L29 [Candidatus Saccharibacteria bacterium]|nr:50S ribosomal protein L29 [Candidatus Saccharibacteria bacterium]